MPYASHDKILEYHKEYYRNWKGKNPELVKAASKRYYEKFKADPERVARNKAYNFEYSRTEKSKATKRLYALAHPETRRRIQRDQRKNRPWATLFNSARERSKKSGRPFSITLAWCEDTYTGKCSMTGVPFVYTRGRPTAYSPSLDRKNSSLGYTPENCRFILWGINRLKNDETDEVVMAIAKAIVGLN